MAEEKIVVFQAKGQNRQSIADLVAHADRVPPAQVSAILRKKMRQLSDASDGMLSPALLRECVIVGALINRVLFELAQIPTDPGFLL